MKDLFEQLAALSQSGEAAVLACVTQQKGSAPGGLGATMLVTAAGRRAGTVGGGAVEYEALQRAAQLLDAGQNDQQAYTLRHGTAGDIGMVCGGDVTVWFQCVPPGPATTAFAQRAAASFGGGRAVWLLRAQLSNGSADMALYSDEDGLMPMAGQASPLAALPQESLAPLLGTVGRLEEIGGLTLYVEPLVRAGRAVVFGGGHISQALVPLLASVGFYTVVLDDRPDFADPALFPAADEVKLCDFSNIEATLPLLAEDWLIVVTRGHAADFEVERQVLQSPHAYVGVIGSRSKTAAVNARLLEAGLPQSAIDSVHTPIGLPIGAVTPAEIAVSITAELIQLRAQRA